MAKKKKAKSTVEVYNSFDDLIEIVNGGKVISIRYDLIFGDESISHINDLQIKKRAYYSLADIIKASMVNVFENCDEDIILPYLSVIYQIKETENVYTFEDFLSDINTLIMNDKVVNFIDYYIENQYVDQMDMKTEETKKTKKINEELQFTDEHVKVLLKFAEAVRLVIPLCTEFCDKRDGDLSDVLYDTFESIISFFEGNNNIMNKIHRFIYSRVISTQYSDKVMWTLLSSRSEDAQVITLEFFKDIIIGIIPKAVEEKNIINLFHVVIRHKLMFAFRKNNKFTFKPINFNQVDSEGLTQFDKWEINMNKRDESKALINKLSIDQQIKYLVKKFGYKITKKEFEYYDENLHINTFQTNLLNLFFAKYMGSYQNLYNCDRRQYVILIIIYHKWLTENKYECLSQYIIAKPDKLNEKRMSGNNKSKICEIMDSSKDYNELLTHTYKHILNLVLENHIFEKMVGNLDVSKFIRVLPYEEYKLLSSSEKKSMENTELKFKIEKLTREILHLAKQF